MGMEHKRFLVSKSKKLFVSFYKIFKCLLEMLLPLNCKMRKLMILINSNFSQ